MPVFSEAFEDIKRGFAARAAAPEQAGILVGDNPTAWNPSDPFRLFIIQLFVIVGFTQILAMFLGRIRQPRVIAEVIAGIILGPTIMGRIPHFTNRIFPALSIPILTLVSTVGLVFYLFLVGLEVDASLVKRNARSATLISAAGILLPFGAGAGIAVPIYNEFKADHDNIKFGYFLLFVAVAVSITAFPVLCRILTELRLLDTDVGITVLAAGVGNDVVGWILLALTVALVNASTGLTALYVLLCAVGFCLFLFFPVKWCYRWLAKKSGSLERGEPTTMMMTITLMMVLISAWYTDVIGIHPIFGGFLAGLIIPKDNGYAISIVEKLEDLVTIVFLPIYFVLSGLKTNLGLLDNGTTWAYVIIIAVVAFSGKFIGCAVTARFSGYSLRESGAVGCLMSCKGLVELIVLNVGLSAGILDTRLFSIFVLDAIILTFITTPLTLWVYPTRLHVHAYGGEGSRDLEDVQRLAYRGDADGLKRRFTVVLQQMDHIPAVMTFVQYLQAPSLPTLRPRSPSSNEKDGLPSREVVPKVSIEAVRLVELSQRTSDVIRGTVADELAQRDSVLNVFKTFAHLNGISVNPTLSIVPSEQFSSVVTAHATDYSSDLVVLPWTLGSSQTDDASNTAGPASAIHNPFQTLFGTSQPYDKAASVAHSHFVRHVFAESPTDVALFLDNPASTGVSHAVSGLHIFLPFFGGPDDRLALDFIVQLCYHPAVTATIIRVSKVDIVPAVTNDTIDAAKAEAAINANLTVLSTSGFPDTLYPGESTETRMQSRLADDLAWNKYESPETPALRDALKRVTFDELESATALRAVLARGEEEAKKAKDMSKSLLVVAARARRLAAESHAQELRDLLTEQHAQSVGTEVRKSLGELACAFVVSNVKAGLLVVQAAPKASPS